MIVQPKRREEVKKITGISVADITNSATITSTGEWVVTLEDDYTSHQKYLPFDRIIITNNGEDDLYFDVNQASGFRRLIPKGTIWTFECPEDLPMVWGWRITNAGTTTITANKIRIGLSRKGMVSDSFAKALSKNVFTKFFLGL